jgi:hypothetical protein
VEVKEQYQVKISNRFAALEKLNDDVNVMVLGKVLRENVRDLATE